MKREKIVCGLDIGSAKVLAAVVKVNRLGNMELVAVHLAESRGIKRGMVTDAANLTDCLAEVRQAITKKSGLRPHDILVGIKGTGFKTRFSKTVIPLLDKGEKVVASADIRRVNHQARALGIEINEEVIHEIPQSYTLDDYHVVKNPFGLFARKIGVDLMLITTPMSHIDSLLKLLNQAGWAVKRLIYSGLAASFSLLSQEQKEQGCVFIDMGAGSTEILVFKDNILREMEILPYGGLDFTESIAEKLKITFDLAEEIKKSYATATSSEVKEEEDILIRKSSTYDPIKRKRLSEVIEPNTKHLLKLIKEKIDNSLYRKYFNSGIVVSGGNSLLYGFLEHAESFLGFPVKMGKVNALSLSAYQTPTYASVLGLVKFAGLGFAEDHLVSLNHKKAARGLFNRIVELYQEYF